MATDNDTAVLQVVFIDSEVPDLQDLLNGLQPGTEAFVLSPGSDGFGQIAAIPAANHLSNLASISIVGHGSDGEMHVGSTMLSEANLASNAAALAAIGAALQPGGDIQLAAMQAAYPDVLAAVADKIIFLSTNDEAGPDDVGTRLENPLRSF